MESLRKNTPWQSFMILLGLTLACALLTQFLAVIGYLFFSGDYKNLGTGLDTSKLLDSPSFLYTSLFISSVGTFLLPSLFLQNLEKHQYQYFEAKPRRISLYLFLTLLFLLVANPIMEYISIWNQNMSFPEALKGLENWMFEKEQQSADLIKQVIMTSSLSRLALNLFVMAVVPAIVEEFYFRGSLQGITMRMFGNPHVAIWVTAIVFSAIHLQFYGFFPRMILGLIFGYSYYWTKNIWIAVFGHFVNNASVTIIAYYLHSQGKSFEEIQKMESYSSIYYILSIVLTLAVGYYFYQVSHKSDEYKQSQLGENPNI